jgi:solute carrier family 35, member F1/2
MQVDWMYFVAFAGTATGLVIYSYRYCAFSVLLALNMDYCSQIQTATSRGSRQISEETAQVTQAIDEEAATANSAAQVPGVGDDGPASNKDFSLAATASR